MSENKINIYTILDPTYLECHDIIMKSLQDDLYTLYSCIRVNRFFCRNFVQTLWRTPFKFIKKEYKIEEKSIKLFNTLIHCLDKSDKENLINKKLIDIMNLPTPNTYFKYHNFIKEFELNPLQKGMRLWTSKYLKDDDSKMSNRKRVSKIVILLNDYIGNLLFGKGNQYESINIFYTDLLSGQKTLFDICQIYNYEKSLIKVNKLSLGFYHSNNNTKLISLFEKKFLDLQNSLSPNIQHLQIYIDTHKDHTELSENLIKFIQDQRNLKSLLINPFYKNDEIFNQFLICLQNQSKSLTYLKLHDFKILTVKVLSILKLLPNLIVLDLNLVIDSANMISHQLLDLPTSLFNNLEHLCYYYKDYQLFHLHLMQSTNSHNGLGDARILLFEKILLSSMNLKSLKVSVTYFHSIKQLQQRFPCNLTHLHLILTNHYPFDDLVIILKNFDQLIHLKLHQIDRIQSQNHWIGSSDNLSKKFSKISLSHSLKILEINFPITEKQLKILLNESHVNIRCIKLYHYEHYKDTLLKVFIDYSRRKNCFKELGIPRNAIKHFTTQCVEEAKNLFNVTLDNKIDDPFYDVPISDPK